MDVPILGNPYKLHKQNEAKAMDHAKKRLATKFDMDHAKKKPTTKFDKLQIEAHGVLKVCKPILVGLTGSIVHMIFGIEAWCVGFVSKHNHFHLGKG
jgi:hypothetical protein